MYGTVRFEAGEGWRCNEPSQLASRGRDSSRRTENSARPPPNARPGFFRRPENTDERTCKILVVGRLFSTVDALLSDERRAHLQGECSKVICLADNLFVYTDTSDRILIGTVGDRNKWTH